MSASPASVPSNEEQVQLLLACRYGDFEDVQEFVKKFGPGSLTKIRDDNGNTVLHMICGNGHSDILGFLGPIVPPTLLSVQNNAQSTALHWAAINQHLYIMQQLVELPGGPGIDLIDMKNEAGRSPLGEAEMAGWQEGAKWLVEVMKLDTDEITEEDGDEVIDESQDVEVEIEDADGQVARMKMSGGGEREADNKSGSSS
ncbi:hypothetical protein PILCRDRAFT_825016 [Piloderma croceum F 1598]|uniref:Uncharacterized protein n=1 Tax=Piloderma croceum (strain F 1598) TaxID=765440 RepID=A0A0C3FD60_PILCF|nr:hypothetical protein PILCRDRAFT_825016 [Piloderma croceum F 1598]